jgi:hypothetical protein
LFILPGYDQQQWRRKQQARISKARNISSSPSSTRRVTNGERARWDIANLFGR